jgi:TolA-binding protein
MAKIKRAFGIYQDGDDIKVALLQLEKNRVEITRLYKDSLSTEAVAEEPVEDDFGGLDDFDFDDFGGDSQDDFNFDMKGPEEEQSPFEEVSEEIEEQDDSSQFILSDIAREMELHQAPLSLNLDIANVFYSTADAPPKSSEKKILEIIKSSFADSETVGAAKFSYVKGDGNQVLGIMHEGPMELLENLYELSSGQNNKTFTFSQIIPDELALVNAVNFNYDIPQDDAVAIFYVGDDYSRVTFMQNGKMLYSFPIINEGFRNSDVINTLYSRYRLEKSHSDLPDPQHIFIAGHVNEEETINILRTFEPEITIATLLPRNIEVSEFEEGESEYSDEELAEFIIPISLALSGLIPENEKLLIPDLLPKMIKEEQNNLSIGFGGLFVLALILGVSLFAIQLNWSGSRKVKNFNLEITQLRNSILANASLIDSLTVKERKIAELEENVARVNKFMGSKNQWHYILEEISNSFLNNPLSWGINLHKEEDKFRLSGSTTKRINIVAFSQLFPGGKIVKVVQRDIQGYKVWDFDILFNMPDPIVTKRLDLQREGITYQSAKKVEKVEKKVEQKVTPKPIEKPTTKIKHDLSGPSLYQKGVKLTFAKKYNDAIVLFDKFLEDNPGSFKANAIYFKGECYFGLRSFKKSLELFNQVIKINKAKQPEALLMLGKVYLNLGNKEMALIHWEKLIAKFPKSKYSTIARRKIARYKDSVPVRKKAIEPTSKVKVEPVKQDSIIKEMPDTAKAVEKVDSVVTVVPVQIESTRVESTLVESTQVESIKVDSVDQEALARTSDSLMQKTDSLMNSGEVAQIPSSAESLMAAAAPVQMLKPLNYFMLKRIRSVTPYLLRLKIATCLFQSILSR